MVAIPPAIHARFAQFLIGKACRPLFTNHLDGLRASRRNPVRRPGHDCGRLTGKPEVIGVALPLAQRMRGTALLTAWDIWGTTAASRGCHNYMLEKENWAKKMRAVRDGVSVASSFCPCGV